MADEISGLIDLTGDDREQFRIAANLLLSEGFLVRSIDRHERSYRFVATHLGLFESYLQWSGRDLRHDASLGVMACIGPPSARVRLRKEESIVALILRLLYEEKAGEIELHGERTVRRGEIQDRYQSLARNTLKKTPFLTLLRRFQALRLIKLVGDDADPDAPVVLYPSIAFALDGGTLDELETRLAELVGGVIDEADGTDSDGSVDGSDEPAARTDDSLEDESDVESEDE